MSDEQVSDETVERVTLSVPIPDGATPEEKQALIDEAVEKEADRFIDDSVNKMLGGLFK